MLSPVSPWVNTLFAQHCSTPPTFPTSPVTFSAKNLDVINDQNPFETKRQKKMQLRMVVACAGLFPLLPP